MNATTTPDKLAPSGQPWAYGIRTWNADGTAHSGFKWDLTAGARNEAPDWRSRAECGGGLHANPDGWGDWTLLNLQVPGKVVGIVRWDPALAVEIDGGQKIKAPWMDVVLSTRDASLGSVYNFINERWRARLADILKAEGASTRTATGYRGHASATGSSGHASATGDYGHASATGDYGHASATGENAIAASLGGGHAKAEKSGAIMLSAYDWVGDKYTLVAVFAGLVGKRYGKVTIKPDTYYRLRTNGVVERVA